MQESNSTIVRNENYDQFEELRAWIERCAAYLQQAVVKFPEHGKINSNCYSEHASTLSAKSFFVAKALLELHESCITLMESASSLTKMCYEMPNDPLFMLAFRSAKLKQELGINRRLLELFVSTMHAQSMGEESFQHFLLLTELEQLLGKQKDEQDFFGKTGSLVQRRIDVARSAILKLEDDNPTLLQSWYLRSGMGKVARAKRYHGRNFSNSFRDRLIYLDGKLTDFEKLAIGFSYGGSYSHSSRAIHYSPSYAFHAHFPDISDFAADIQVHAFLSLHILKYLGTMTSLIIEKLDESLATLEKQIAPIVQRVASPFEIDDLVLADGGLAQITGVLSGGIFGYRAYKVRFLEDAPQEPDDIYLSAHLTFVASAERIIEARRAVYTETDFDSVEKSIKSTWPKDGIEYWRFLKQHAGNESLLKNLPDLGRSRI